MKTVHPPELSLTRQAMPIAGQMRLILTMALCFPLHDDAAHPSLHTGTKEIIAADMLWQAALSSLAAEDVLDLGIPKGGSEWLMAGSACAPHGNTVTGLPVDVHVGAMHRQFLVSGQCANDGVALPHPRPFSIMPLSWRHTYGGARHPENPLGIGMDKDSQSGLLFVPNVMCNNDPTKPACPGPRNSAVLPQGKLGTFDIQWLRTRWPGPPDDFNWSYYNLAQPEQRQATSFVGNEHVRVTNMHAHHPILYGALPEKRVRVFLNTGTDDAAIWQEVAAQADTVWLFPNAKLGGVFWRAAIAVDDERATNICTLAVSVEDMNMQPRPAAQCIATASDSLLVSEADVAPSLAPEASLANPQQEAPAFIAPPIPPLMPPLVSPPPPPVAPPVAQGLATSTRADAPPLSPENTFDMDAEIRESVQIANEELAKYNLPPITEADVRAQLEKQQALLADAQKIMDEPQPSLEELMAQAGFSPEHSANLLKATELPMPSPDKFLTEEAYEQGIQHYINTFTELTNAPEGVQKQLLQGIRLSEDFSNTSWQPAHGPKTMLQKLGLEDLKDIKGMEALNSLDSLDTLNPLAPLDNAENAASPQAIMSMLTASGMSSAEAQKMAAAIELPMPADASTESMKTYMAAFEKAAGLSPNSMVSVVDKQAATMRLGLYVYTDIPVEIQNLAAAQSNIGTGLGAESLAALDRLGKDLECMSSGNVIPTLPGDGQLDLAEMAQSYGVTNSALLALLAGMDPLPNKALPRKPVIEEEVAMSPLAPPLSSPPLSSPPPLTASPSAQSDMFSVAKPVPSPTTGAALVAALRQGHDGAGHDFSDHDFSEYDFSGLDCTGCDFSRLTLDRARFVNATLAHCRFIDAQLTGANFAQARLLNTNFAGAAMAGCHMHHMEAQGVTFQGADLHGSQWEQVTMHSMDATQADLDNVRMHKCVFEGSFAHSTWNDSVLVHTTFSKSDFTQASFERSRLEHCVIQGTAHTVTFLECHVHNVTMQGTLLQSGRFYRSVFDYVDMGGCDISHSSWLSIQATHLTLDKAMLTEAIFEECALSGAQAARVSARACRFIACDLRKAHMPRLDLFSGALRFCKLDEANLAGASLYAADMDGADITTRTNMLDADIAKTCLVRGA